jgi:hypothetical protein
MAMAPSKCQRETAPRNLSGSFWREPNRNCSRLQCVANESTAYPRSLRIRTVGAFEAARVLPEANV